jgi:hypothetical protein
MAKEQNVGMIDRIFRVAFGIAFITGPLLYLAPPVSYLFFILGAILLITGLFGKCPAYTLLGISTCGGMCDIKKLPKSNK